MKRFSNKKIAASIVIAIIFLLPFVKEMRFETGEIGRITQVLNPDIPKGALEYDPHHHYDYIIANVSTFFGVQDKFAELAGIFWMFDILFGCLVLVLLCNHLFKNDPVTSFIVVLVFVFQSSGAIDQKTMALPLYMLAIYFFLKEKWIFSGIATASLFYFHIGMAVWWFLPSCFAISCIYFKEKRVSAKEAAYYVLTVIFLASPIIAFYLSKTASGGGRFAIDYFYHLCSYCSSVTLTATTLPLTAFNTSIMVAGVLFGLLYVQDKKDRNRNIIPVLVGMGCMYLLNFVFSDILRVSAAVRLQLLRSVLNIEILFNLFMGYILAKQVKRGNFVFFQFYLVVIFAYGFLRKFFGDDNQYIVMNVFYTIALLYEFIGRKAFTRWERPLSKIKVLQTPVFLVLFALFLVLLRMPILKTQVKKLLRIPEYKAAVQWEADDLLFYDIGPYTNKNLAGNNIMLLSPFLKPDFSYFTRHRIFITYLTPMTDAIYEYDGYSVEKILKDDLNFPIENFFNNYTSEKFYGIWQKLWQELDEDIIFKWKGEHHLTHVIREKKWPLDFPIIYQNNYYNIYEIR